ncbi:MAG: ankyrin repeat domain-containing protein [Treponema sp.]|nr:ankyrin repeat domain-containing protein [Treponema sp.]
MTFLLLSQNDIFSKVINASIHEIEKNAKIYSSDFSKKSIKKQIKYFEKLSLILIFKEENYQLSNEDITNLSALTGYALAKDVLILTNIFELEELNYFQKENLVLLKSKNDFIEYIKQKYESISSTDTKRLSKKKLLEKGIPFTPDCFGTYIAKDKTEICNLFISGGMDINSRDENGTPLINIAVRNDNEELVKKFIKLGADINLVSEDRGYTPVMDAVWRGNLELTKLFIKEGAELNTINKEGQSNLVLAVGADRVKIVEVLAKAGADPDIKDQMGMSAYGYASLFKKVEILKILEPYHKPLLC